MELGGTSQDSGGGYCLRETGGGSPGECRRLGACSRGRVLRTRTFFKCHKKTQGSSRMDDKAGVRPHLTPHLNSPGIRVIISTFQLKSLEPSNV